MQNGKPTSYYYKLSIYGFIAGFLATLTVHQFTLFLLREAAIAPFAPYNMAATQPWGIPAVVSLALWGGVWGVLFAFLQEGFPRDTNYWITAFGFGAVFPSLVALFVVAPMKGHPIAGGWLWQPLLTAFLINGVWGLGTGAIVKWMKQKSKMQREHSAECRPGVAC